MKKPVPPLCRRHIHLRRVSRLVVDFLASNGRLRINAHYYIAKALIPPMERILRDCLGVCPLLFLFKPRAE